MLYGYPDFIIEKMENSSLTENLNMNLSVCLADAASIKLNTEEQEELNVEYEELIYTSNKAFIRKDLTLNTSSRTSSDSQERKFVVGAIANKTIDEKNTSKLIIFGNELFVSDMQVNLNGYDYYIAELYNNSDVVLNSIAYLTDREEDVVSRKRTGTVIYAPTEQQDTIVRIIIFAVPIVIILAGIIVWQKRRRKK